MAPERSATEQLQTDAKDMLTEERLGHVGGCAC